MDLARYLIAFALTACIPSCGSSPQPPETAIGQVTGTIRGTDNLPLEGAVAMPLAHDTLLEITDSTGTYRLALPPGTAVISYRMLGVEKRVDTIEVVLDGTTTHDVVLPTLASAHLTVLLLDEEGAPLPSAFAGIIVGNSGIPLWTDADGMAHWVVRPGLVRVVAWRQGAADWQVSDSLIVAPGERATVELQMKNAVHRQVMP